MEAVARLENCVILFLKDEYNSIMKHVFVINSHTTFLTAYGTIMHLKLDWSDVIFLYMRNYQNSCFQIQAKVVDVTDLFEVLQANWFRKQDFYTDKVDSLVLREIKERYHLYVPHLAAILFKLLYTNNKCRRVAFIQEGAICQSKVFDSNVSFKERLSIWGHLVLGRWRTFGGNWYLPGSKYKQIVLDSYAINADYYKNLPSHNHIVSWPKIEMENKYPSHSTFFIFDGFINNGLAEADIYCRTCKKLIQTYISQKNNYIKFHPGQGESEIREITSCFEELGMPFSVIDNGLPMELVVCSTEGMRFVGFGSSILHFAKQHGHKVICRDDWLFEESKLFRTVSGINGLRLFSDVYPGENFAE